MFFLGEYKLDIKYYIYFLQIKIQQIMPQIAVPKPHLFSSFEKIIIIKRVAAWPSDNHKTEEWMSFISLITYLRTTSEKNISFQENFPKERNYLEKDIKYSLNFKQKTLNKVFVQKKKQVFQKQQQSSW